MSCDHAWRTEDEYGQQFHACGLAGRHDDDFHVCACGAVEPWFEVVREG